MNGKTIIPFKVDPSPDQQVKDPDMYTLHDTCDISIKQVFNGKPHKRCTVATVRETNHK